MNTWSEVSKAVGYAEQVIPFPTLDQVKEVAAAKGAYKLLSWHRFLPTASNPEEQKVIDLVNKELEKVKKGMEP